MLYLRYGNVEIKKQTQIFVTVSYYFRMQEYRKKLLMSKQISDDIKQFSYEICQKHKVIIRYMETDKEHTFWTDGYFVCSVGNVSEEMLRKYIENQG